LYARAPLLSARRSFSFLLPAPFFCFFFEVTAPTVFYTLSLHDALPISVSDDRPPAVHNGGAGPGGCRGTHRCRGERRHGGRTTRDRKSTRLNSSHEWISYAVFCLKKKTHKSSAMARRSAAKQRASE